MWALGAWQYAARGTLEFHRARIDSAGFASIGRPPSKGFTVRPDRVQVDGRRGAEVYVLPAPLEPNSDQLLRDAIVYLTCLHETGHALGLSHTAVFDDIMYSFQFGGDIPEYFGRYRRKLKPATIFGNIRDVGSRPQTSARSAGQLRDQCPVGLTAARS